MKITLDLSKLVEDGKLTAAEAERLKALAAQETGHLGLNILTGFGVIAASAGAVAILLTAFQFTAGAGAIIGGAVFAIGLALLISAGNVFIPIAVMARIIAATPAEASAASESGEEPFFEEAE